MKTNKFWKFGIASLMTLVLAGCEITELPYTSVTDEELQKNPAAIQAVTMGSYSQLKSESFIKGYHYLGEYGSDNVALSGSTTDGLMYIYNFQRTKDNSHLSNQWGIFNRIIINCNNVIALATEGTSKEVDHLLGENYFMRGWIYYQLANTFGRAYHKATDADLATPIKLSTDLEEFPARATVKAQYEQIVKDLKKAEALMQGSGINKSAIFANTWAAKALLSRVYLSMHDYENAEKYATDVIENGNTTLISNASYATMNTFTPESNPEAIFAVRRVKDLDISDNGWYDVGSLYATIDGSGWGEMYASEPLVKLLGKYPNDVRSSFIVPQYEDKAQNEFIFKSRNYITDDNGAEDPMIMGVYREYFRYADVELNGGKYTFADVNAVANHELRSTEVQKDAGGLYVEVRQKRTKADKVTVLYGPWFKAYGTIQGQMEKRNDHFKYFMTKCSYQERQTHLWSPMILRLSEMYLNRAEARIHLGKSGEAIADINVIKERAGIPAYNPAIDGANLLDAYLDERRRELYLEAHRFFDLMRNDKPMMRNYPGWHDRGAVSAVKMVVVNTDNCAIQYIPQREINAYPIPLTQNPD